MPDILAGVFFFFSRICNCICVHHVSLWFLAASTDFVLSFAVVCLYSVHFSFPCAKGSFCAFVIFLLFTRLPPSACGNAKAFVMSVQKLS